MLGHGRMHLGEWDIANRFLVNVIYKHGVTHRENGLAKQNLRSIIVLQCRFIEDVQSAGHARRKRWNSIIWSRGRPTNAKFLALFQYLLELEHHIIY